MDKRQRLKKHYNAMDEFRVLLNNIHIKDSAKFDTPFKPIQGENSIKKWLLDTFDRFATFYLFEQPLGHLSFQRMNLYMTEATGDIQWLRSNWFEELLTHNKQIDKNNNQSSDFSPIIASDCFLHEDVKGSVTEILMDTSAPLDSGREYWIVNLIEKAKLPPNATLTEYVYPIVPSQSTNSVGIGVKIKIDEQIIFAPKGSPVIESPAQVRFEQSLIREKILNKKTKKPYGIHQENEEWVYNKFHELRKNFESDRKAVLEVKKLYNETFELKIGDNTIRRYAGLIE